MTLTRNSCQQHPFQESRARVKSKANRRGNMPKSGWLFGLLVLAGCGNDQLTRPALLKDDPRSQAEDVLFFSSYFPNVVAGGTLPGRASFRPQFPPDWSSSDPGVATVVADGHITGVAPGETLIRSTLGRG